MQTRAAARKENLRADRVRQFPLVPERFGNLALGGYIGQGTPRPWCSFVPDLDIIRYRQTKTEEDLKKLDRRANKICKWAAENLLEKPSEDKWEGDTTAKIFGKIRADSRLCHDKRRCYFKGIAKDGKSDALRYKIPDQTFGLRTYARETIEHKCIRDDCGEGFMQDHGKHISLCKERLGVQLRSHAAGLVVDPKWGEVSLAFPWGAYEAKQNASFQSDSEDQIYSHAQVYLGMLDDLARNPEDPAFFQFENSKKYQIFLFTACGPQWYVYVAYNFFGCCKVDRIWDGDIKGFLQAVELLCIVDQIHEWAITEHRDFVIKHIEAWIRRGEKTEAEKLKAEKLAPDVINTASLEWIRRMTRTHRVSPEWQKWKDRADAERIQKGLRTTYKKRKFTGFEEEESIRYGQGHVRESRRHSIVTSTAGC